MFNRLVRSPIVYPYLLIATAISIAIGVYSESKILLPLLNIAAAYPVMFTLLRFEQRKRAIGTMLFWALCMAVLMVYTCVHFPLQAEASIFHGKAYAAEMMNWVRTGNAPENEPLRFVPQHLLHFFVFVALSLLTGSLLSLLMGALLMNYMCFYVGTLVNAAAHPLTATLMGWQPYAIIRVCSYVILGVILGEPMICRVLKKDYEYDLKLRPFYWAALTGVVLDIIIKFAIAPWWGLVLRAAMR